jgi:hypothetical protein
MLDSYKDGSAFQAIWQWCRGLTGSQPRFGNCGDEDVERMAHDLGVSTKELRQLASHGPKSADLLLERLTALDLDENEVARTEPATFQDMQRVCTMCDSHRRLRARSGARSVRSGMAGLLPERTHAHRIEYNAVGGTTGVVNRKGSTLPVPAQLRLQELVRLTAKDCV